MIDVSYTYDFNHTYVGKWNLSVLYNIKNLDNDEVYIAKIDFAINQYIL